MYTPINVLTNYLRARAYRSPFYAVDLGLNGGEINGLQINGLIEPTGNTTEVDLVLKTWSDKKIIKTVQVKEWRCVDEKEMSPCRLALLQRDIQQAVAKAMEIVGLWSVYNESDGE